jgi:phosphoribosylpyrophosphate synthetase
MAIESEIISKQSFYDRDGHLLVLSAPEVSWEAGQALWTWETNKFNERWFNRGNFQIAILGSRGDAASDLSYLLNGCDGMPCNKMLTKRIPYGDGEYDLLAVNEGKPDSVYVVASITNSTQLEDAERIADHCRNTLGAKMVTLVMPFLDSTRGDKNGKLISPDEVSNYPVDKVYVRDGNYYIYEPRSITSRVKMTALSAFYNRVIGMEFHSGATQTYAFEVGLPVLNLSPNLWIFRQLIERGMSFDGWTLIRPDIGRNIASTRIARWLRGEYNWVIEEVGCLKERYGANLVKLNIRPEDLVKISGKHCFAYDDEVATAATYKKLEQALVDAGAVDLTALYVHPKFIDNWYENISGALIKLIIGTNSRMPVGDTNHLGDRHKQLSIAPFLLDIITADVKGVNYWQDKYWRQMILQTQPEERE